MRDRLVAQLFYQHQLTNLFVLGYPSPHERNVFGRVVDKLQPVGFDFAGERIDEALRVDRPVRCQPADELDSVLGALSAEHHDDLHRARTLIVALERALADGRAPGQDRESRLLFTDFALHERRHIALENAVVLPIARLRLTAADLRSLSIRLAARRGVLLDPEGDEAAL